MKEEEEEIQTTAVQKAPQRIILRNLHHLQIFRQQKITEYFLMQNYGLMP